MRDGQVILFRRNGKFLLGRYMEGPRGKLQVGLEPGRVVRINPQQVVLELDAVVDPKAFPTWREQCGEIAQHMDLEEVWEMVHDEPSRLTLEQLAELHWDAPPDPLQRAALQVHLWTDPPYFTRHDSVFAPRSPEELEARRRQREQERAAARDEETFLGWLSGEEPPAPWTGRQEQWLEQLRGFAVHGDSYHAASTARRFLRRLRRDASDPRRMAFHLLVERGIFQEDEPLELHRAEVSLEFSPQALQTAEELLHRATPHDGGRRDLTDLELLTIDEASTRDMDDGVSLQETPDGYLLGIHVTDASALAPAEGVLDDEAARRMATLYLPERTLPMLPVRLTEELGSLSPGRPRLALSVLVHLDQGLQPDSWEVTPSIVRSRARLTYQEVDRSLAEEEGSDWSQTLAVLETTAQGLRQRRLAAGALEFSRPELKVQVDSKGDITVSVLPSPTPARRLVAEFMVLANQLLGEFCRRHSLPAIYRVQEAVDLGDLEEVASPILRGFLLMRRLRPSSLVLDPRPHTLLGVPVYLQATSPLRRYPDLMIQRQVLHLLLEGTTLYDRQAMEQLLFQASVRMRELARLEEARKRYWLLKHLGGKIGETFQAVVLTNHGHEVLVELVKYTLRANAYLADPGRPGETVAVQLSEVDLWNQTARLNSLPSGG